MKGSGMPVMGMMPTTIRRLRSSGNRIIEARPAEMSRPNRSGERQPLSRMRQRSSVKSPRIRSDPTKPNSPAQMAKAKWVGREDEKPGPDDRERGIQLLFAQGEEARQGHDHEDLGQLAELELEPDDRHSDPAGDPARARPGQERDPQEHETGRVERAAEGPDPRVVEGRGQEIGQH